MAEGQDNVRLIARNPKARHLYAIEDTYEAGIVLEGTEVKSLRQGNCSIAQGYAKMEGEELFLYGVDIPPFPQAGQFNHEPKRPRKLLLHNYELNRVASKCQQKGYTVVPLSLYFRHGYAKIEIGLAKRITKGDKRRRIEEEQRRRDIERELKRRGKR